LNQSEIIRIFGKPILIAKMVYLVNASYTVSQKKFPPLNSL